MGNGVNALFIVYTYNRYSFQIISLDPLVILTLRFVKSEPWVIKSASPLDCVCSCLHAWTSFLIYASLPEHPSKKQSYFHSNPFQLSTMHHELYWITSIGLCSVDLTLIQTFVFFVIFQAENAPYEQDERDECQLERSCRLTLLAADRASRREGAGCW